MSLQRISFAEACAFSAPGERTFFGSNGLLQTAAAGVPRLDYDPVTLAPKGVLIEGTRTNSILQSGTFEDASWAKVGCTVAANSGISPTGETSSDKIVEGGSTSLHACRRIVALSANTTYSCTFFAAASERNFARCHVFVSGVGGAIVYVNLSTLAVTTSMSVWALVLASAVALPSAPGVVMVKMVFSVGGTGGDAYFDLGPTTESGVTTYTGDSASGIYAWGVSVEAGAFPSSSITTATMAVTRAADILTVQPAQFAAAFRQDAGTILIDMTLNHTGLNSTGGNDFPFLLDMDSAAAPGDGYSVLASGGYGPGFRLNVATGAADQATFTIAKALGGGSRTKLALSWGGANDFAACMDGGAVQTDTSGTLPTPDRLSIGCQNGSNNQMFGHVRKVLFFPQRLTNTQLQEATA